MRDLVTLGLWRHSDQSMSAKQTEWMADSIRLRTTLLFSRGWIAIENLADMTISISPDYTPSGVE
jgi:hypothetical protein